MALTPAQKEAYARANTSQIVLWNLELRHPVWPTPIRVTQSFDGSKVESIDFLLEPVDNFRVDHRRAELLEVCLIDFRLERF